MTRLRACLLLWMLGCAERRSLPGAGPTEAPAVAASQSAPTTLAEAAPVSLPAGFLASPFAEGRFTAAGAPLPDAVSALLVADLNEDGAPEVVIAPGERDCGTGGCAPARVYRQTPAGPWEELGALSVPGAVTPRWTSITVDPHPRGAFGDLLLARDGAAPVRAVYHEGTYALAVTPPEALSPGQESSLLLMQGRYDVIRGFVPLGIWDKHGANEGARAMVRVRIPDGKTFEKELGVVGYPDEWHQALFPKEFARAPQVLPPGRYLAEYFLDGSLAGSSAFEVPRL